MGVWVCKKCRRAKGSVVKLRAERFRRGDVEPQNCDASGPPHLSPALLDTSNFQLGLYESQLEANPLPVKSRVISHSFYSILRTQKVCPLS